MSLALGLAALCMAAIASAACPPQGEAADDYGRELNRLKNRETEPATFGRPITLEALLVPGDDVRRWANDRGVVVEATVVDVVMGAVESCNCHATGDDDRDTHLELALDAGEIRGSRRVIAEVTPRWRRRMAARGVDWSTQALRAHLIGRRVRIRGWMLFDGEHMGDARNTAPRGRGNARATAWEIHPVTGIDPLP